MKMSRSMAKALSYIIRYCPTNAARIFLLRNVKGFAVGPECSIGFNVLIDVDEFRLGANSTISRNNRFSGPIKVLAGEGVFIGKSNNFTCGWSVAEPWAKDRGYLRTIEIGDKCLINEAHIFDVIGKISIAQGTWIAGFRSQFLAHGASVQDRDITIGARNFIGSAALFCPGSGVGNDCLVGMGSVVTKPLDANNCIIAGVPAKIVRARTPDDGYDWQKVW